MDQADFLTELNISPEYAKRYSITRDGRIFCRGQRKAWLILSVDKRRGAGYLTAGLFDGVSYKRYRVHRLVATVFLDNPRNLPQVNHINGIKTDNRVENLEWCTGSENRKHAFRIGLSTPTTGEKNGMAKLNKAQVMAMREMKNNGASRKYLANLFSIDPAAVSNIINLKRWGHI